MQRRRTRMESLFWGPVFGVAVLLLLVCCTVGGETIEFPEEELARETVLPRFNATSFVQNRNIVLKSHLEVGLGAGLNLQDALYNKQNFHVDLHYNFSETHAVGLTYIHVMQGLSEMGQELKAGRGIEPDTFDASLAPTLERMVLGEYQLMAYYGKVSFSKYSVMNLALYGLLGAGTVSFSDLDSYALSVGFGQKFYLNKRMAVRGDLRLIVYEGPNPIQDNPDLQVGDPPVSSRDLDSVFYFPIFLNIGIEFII